MVDANNLVSLESLLPISLVDLRRANAHQFRLRRGKPGESYVFNAAGQIIELEDLLLVSRLPDDVACANPVKDSMATKLDEHAQDVLGVLYAPTGLHQVLAQATRRFADVLATMAGAEGVTHGVMA